MAVRGDFLDPTESEGDADRPVRHVVNMLESRAQQDKVALSDLVEACGTVSFVPAIMIPALLVVSPLSGIPLYSSFCGIAIAFIAAQMLFKRKHLYLPDAVRRRQLPGDRVRKGLGNMRRVADFLDRHTHKGRLRQLVGHGGRILPQLLSLIAGASMPLLEIVPFSSSILGAAVLSFSIGLLTHDGAFVLVGMAIMATVIAAPLFIVVNGV